MKLRVTVTAGGEPGRVWEFAESATVRVGASAAGEVVLAGDEWVAATHCALYWGDGGWRVRDLGEGGGTWRNGVGVTDEALASGDVVQCGRTQVRVEWETERAEAAGGVGEGSERDPRAEALATLRVLPGRLYAVLDAAKDPEVLQLLRRSGYRYECLYTGWAREVYGEAAPYLVQLRRNGRLLEQLLAYQQGVFLLSEEPMVKLARGLRRCLLVVHPEYSIVIARWYCGSACAAFVSTEVGSAIKRAGALSVWSWSLGERPALHQLGE